MDAALKKGAVLLVLVFVGFYLFTDPSGLATAAKDAATAIWGGLHALFEVLIRFLDALFA